MNPEQKSLTLAFMVVFASITIRNNWYARAKVWLTSSPSTAKAKAPATTKPQYGVSNWQAAIATYVILMVISETPAAPVVPPIAWGVALIEIMTAFGSGSNTIPGQFPSLFSGTPYTTSTVSAPNQSTATLPEGNLVGV